jgi:hypothetical protein
LPSLGFFSILPLRICVEAAWLPLLLGSGEEVFFLLVLRLRAAVVVLDRPDPLLLHHLSPI